MTDAPPAPAPPPNFSQSAPYELTDKGRRFLALLLDGLLAIVTLGIGWIIWSVILRQQGQSPAKSIMKMRVLKLDAGRAANMGDMVMRVLVGMWVLSIVPLWYVINGVVLLMDQDKYQCLWDKLAGTTVIDDPDGRWKPAAV